MNLKFISVWLIKTHARNIATSLSSDSQILENIISWTSTNENSKKSKGKCHDNNEIMFHRFSSKSSVDSLSEPIKVKLSEMRGIWISARMRSNFNLRKKNEVKHIQC